MGEGGSSSRSPDFLALNQSTNYSGCQENVPIAERFFATTLMPPFFFRNIIVKRQSQLRINFHARFRKYVKII
jgi:hypothetical protein